MRFRKYWAFKAANELAEYSKGFQIPDREPPHELKKMAPSRSGISSLSETESRQCPDLCGKHLMSLDPYGLITTDGAGFMRKSH
jgi:hypothetical protein